MTSLDNTTGEPSTRAQRKRRAHPRLLVAGIGGLIGLACCALAILVWFRHSNEDETSRQMVSVPFNYLEFSSQALKLPCEWFFNSIGENGGNSSRVVLSTIETAFPFQKSIRISLKGDIALHQTNSIVSHPIVAKVELQISTDDHYLVARSISLLDCRTLGEDNNIDLFLKDSSAALAAQLDDCLTFYKHPLPVAGYSLYDMEHFSIILQENTTRNNQ